MLHSFEHQDDFFSSAFSILREAIAQRAFPAATAAVTHRGRLVALKAFGHFTYDNDNQDAEINGGVISKAGAPSWSRSSRQGGDFDVTPPAIFDLASVTKAVATTTMAMLLHERGLFDLEAPVTTIIPEFAGSISGNLDPRRQQVTLRMLLAHSSGLPAYEKLFLKSHTREELLYAAFAISLTADPGTRADYSDIGFILLGVALERLAGESLACFCQREIFTPLGMANTKFNPPPELRTKIPPTADERESCSAGALASEILNLPATPSVSRTLAVPPHRSTFRNRIIQGEVQDENAFVLGGVAGHAGLFSTAEDLARFAHAMLGNPILKPETIALFTRREPAPPNTSRALGWDTPSAPSQAGKYFGPTSFGHLGYTGTSLWIDPARQLSIVLLTNRTWPDCSNQAIKQVRPKFHDAVVEALNRIPERMHLER